MAASDIRILIVDDDPRIRRVIARTFDDLGYSTEQRDSGASALEALRTEAFNVVFLDVMMPGEDGFQTAARVRAGEVGPGNQEVPIVFVTAESDVDSFERSFEVGAHRYVTKPFEPETLVSTVEALLQPAG